MCVKKSRKDRKNARNDIWSSMKKEYGSLIFSMHSLYYVMNAFVIWLNLHWRYVRQKLKIAHMCGRDTRQQTRRFEFVSVLAKNVQIPTYKKKRTLFDCTNTHTDTRKRKIFCIHLSYTDVYNDFNSLLLPSNTQNKSMENCIYLCLINCKLNLSCRAWCLKGCTLPHMYTHTRERMHLFVNVPIENIIFCIRVKMSNLMGRKHSVFSV